MASLPPPPPGFVLDGPTPPRRKLNIPPPPAGFVIDVSPGTNPHDGDTFRVGGQSARLYGADAFELDQMGIRSGSPVPLGLEAQQALRSDLTGGGRATATGAQTYGRPVMSLSTPRGDAGANLIGNGLALPTPSYLANDPARMTDYLTAQRGAIAAERGAYAGQYQAPQDYRRQGAAAPMRGKIPMTPTQRQQYTALLRNPKTTEAQLSEWMAAQGQAATNVGNILSFARQNPSAKPATYFQQQDAVNQPVLPDGPGVAGRTLGALNEGIADTLGAPVDLVNGGLGMIGLPMSEDPFGGSASIRRGLHAIGVGQESEAYAPRSTTERYAQSIARGVGQVALPLGGTLAAGVRVGAAGAGLASQEGGAVAQGLRRMVSEAAARPGVALAGEVGGGIGSGVGGQAARDAFPGNPYADMVGQVLGGIGGGVGAGASAARLTRPRMLGGAARSAAPVEVEAIGGQPVRLPDVISTRLYGPAQPMRLNAPPAGRVNTRAPERVAPAPYPPERVASEVEAWANTFGARPANGTRPDVMLHGSPVGNIDEFDPYGRGGYGLFGAGVYLTDSPAIAASYTGKGLKGAAARGGADQTVYAVRQAVKNPLDMDAPADRAVWDAAAKKVMGDYSVDGYFSDIPEGATNERMWREVEDILSGDQVTASEGRETMDAFVRSLGHDGITHIGGGRVGKDGPRHRVVIALDPEQVEIAGRLSINDMVNPKAPRAPDWIDISTVPPPPAGFVLDKPPAAAGSDVPPPPPGFVLDSDLLMPTNGPDQMGANGLAALARTIDPRDVRPIPANTVGSLDEAIRANPGTFRDVPAPNERDALTPYRLRADGPQRRDPLDLIGWLRTQGGIQDQGGNLRSAGIDNRARPIDFAKSEGFLGRLVNDQGMTLDEAARAAHDAGYFPDLPDRPTVNEFLDALADTHRGGSGRMFHPDDYAAIDEYQAARDQRYAVERAEQEGAPLAEDVGQPVDMADLDANQPPATAYEDLRAPGGRVGNIDVSKLTTGEDIGRALATVDERFGGFGAARRGRVSQAETAALAGEMGMTPETLLKRRRGQALNAEQALAARQLLAKSGENLVDLAGKAVGGSDESVAEFHRALLRHAAIQEQVSGATAEAGRTLAQFRMAADAKVVPASLFQEVISSAGGRKSVEDAAETLLEMQRLTGDPSKLNAFALKAAKPGAKDKLIEWWYNSLLSGPQTHVVNTVSNGLTSILQVPEHAVASAIGKARSAVTGSSDRVLSSEVGARAFGLVKGLKEGLDAFRYTFRTGIVPDHVAKVESALQEAIPGRLGKIVRTPTRLLAAEDEMFKAIARRMELNSLAVRQANREKLTGVDLRNRISELSAEPTDDMMADATKYARYVTFQNPLGPGLQAISNATNRSIPFKMVLPFLRTPTNIFSFAAERSPLAPFVRGWRADMAAGGARRDLALARASMGSGLGLMISQWALNGDITGSRPRDRAAADMMQADGWQPYSIRVGDRYYSYQRLDPVAMTLGFAADLATGIEKMNKPDSDKAGDEMLAMLMQQLKDKSFLSGISDVSNAIDSRNGNLGERLASYGGRQVGSLLVPTLAAQVARTVDPVQRDARDMAGPILSRIPGLSSRLTPRTDSWGRPIINEGGVGPDLLSPMRMRTLRRDPLTAEMLRVGAPMGEPSRTVAGRKLTRPEMNAYKLATGNIVRGQLSGMIATPEWRGLPVEQQRSIIDKTVTASRKRARVGMFGGGSRPSTPLAPPPGFVMDGPSIPPPPGFFPMTAPPPGFEPIN